MAGLYISIMGDETDLPVGQEATEDASDEDERSQQTSILMTRLLFLLYGDDANLWEADLFYRWVDEETTPSTLGAQLNQLFDVLNTSKNHRSKNIPGLMAQFPHVNGSLFADALNAEFFTPETHEALLQACAFRWNRISVSVFGAMFQLVKSKEARRTAGEHYTSEKNILKTIGPLFLDEYRSRADRLIANKSTRAAQFDAFLDEMASNIYCDPACGGGNFLNIAYAKLREIETDVLAEKQRRGGEFTASLDISFDQKISIDQFWGFEINWWPAKIAETAMFLVDHQANLKLAAALGDAPERLPIKITAHIVHANALRLDWAKTLPEPKDGRTFIFGNPPFIGQKEKAQDPQKVKDMKQVWGEKYDGYLDFVTAWFAKSVHLLTNREGEFAFVSTNSITQGQPVNSLFGYLYDKNWDIKFAHRTFAWDSEAPGQANVHCVIIGFTRDKNIKPRLWDYKSYKSDPHEVVIKTGINAYLLDAPRVLITKRSSSKMLNPQLPAIKSGSKAVDWKNFEVTEDDLEEVNNDPVARKYLRLHLGGEEVINGTKKWCLWLRDVSHQDIQNSKIIRERIEAVRARRIESGTNENLKFAQTPNRFGADRQPDFPYLAIPQTFSENRDYATAKRLDKDVIASIKLFTARDEDGFLFGLISSSMFMVWLKAVGGKQKSDPSFSNTIVWNSFPLPEISDEMREKIIKAGAEVFKVRDLYPELSLAELYNPLSMKSDLRAAHNNLDKVVDTAFGASRRLTTDTQRLELLIKNYLKLTQGK
ncbi:GcrY protein [Rothia sp. ZJ932]|nr:GcrY protein [Rothia sp. ZJ932]